MGVVWVCFCCGVCVWGGGSGAVVAHVSSVWICLNTGAGGFDWQIWEAGPTRAYRLVEALEVLWGRGGGVVVCGGVVVGFCGRMLVVSSAGGAGGRVPVASMAGCACSHLASSVSE